MNFLDGTWKLDMCLAFFNFQGILLIQFESTVPLSFKKGKKKTRKQKSKLPVQRYSIHFFGRHLSHDYTLLLKMT